MLIWLYYSLYYNLFSIFQQSLFSNSAWTWNEKRNQYYLHQFDPKQPDLNYRNKELVEEMKVKIILMTAVLSVFV